SDQSGKPVLTFVFLRAVFSTLNSAGVPGKQGDTPFRSNTFSYNVVPAPQLSMKVGCYDGSGILDNDFPAASAATPALSDRMCWPAVEVKPSFLGPTQAQLTVNRAQYFSNRARGEDLMPPRTVRPSDPPQVFPLTSRDTRGTGLRPSYSELGAA